MTDRLTSTERDRSSPNVRPRDAATLIIIDRSAKTPTVLMGRRHPGHKFMPGKFVFPGGRIEPGDRSMPVAGALHPRAEEALLARTVRPSA
ncbi:MAG: NUDIX hydrolase, partial [Pseudomonadota bacterium]|nr:NUDIX hydrolase [Pseudomonadota bacterium]